MIRKKNRFLLTICLTTLTVLLSGCQALLPYRSVRAEEQGPLFKAPAFQPTFLLPATPTASAILLTTQTAECTNQLTFIPPDITIPDGTEIAPGAPIDKRWKIKNSGTCNWDDTYALQLTGGEAMGASSTQALVPVRNGVEAEIQILFTAPLDPGTYRSEWKALAPNGQPFGDLLYMEIVVPAP